MAGCPQEGRLPPPASLGPCLLRFLASERALLLLFSDGTVQVSGLVLGGWGSPVPRVASGKSWLLAGGGGGS